MKVTQALFVQDKLDDPVDVTHRHLAVTIHVSTLEYGVRILKAQNDPDNHIHITDTHLKVTVHVTQNRLVIDKRAHIAILGVLCSRACGKGAIGITGTGVIGLTVCQLAGTLDCAQLRGLKGAFECAVIGRTRGECLRTADLHPQRPCTLDRDKSQDISGIEYRIALSGVYKYWH